MEAGKGDTYRPCDPDKMAENWPYPERRIKTWPRDKNGELIDRPERPETK